MSVHVTHNEIAVMKACLNYDSRESQLSDNYSNGTFENLLELGYNRHQVSGLISSLEGKDLAIFEDDILWLEEAGVNVIFDIIEAEKLA